MGIVTDEIRIIMGLSGAQGYVNAMNQVTRSTGGFETSVGRLTAALSKLVSAAAIVKFSKQCIQAASDLQEVANVVNVTFGQNADIIEKWAKTQAMNFGLSEKAAKEYAGTFGTMAKQFGFTLDQATAMGVKLAELTGDVASFYNIEDKLASTKLKSVFTGETETLKELGVVMTEANLNAYALEKGLGKTVKQMTEHEKVYLRYSFVMEKLNHTQGDFQRTSDGWANSVRKFKLELENLKIEIGNQLLPVAGQGLAAISKGLAAISPVLVSAATTVRLYSEAWKNASAQTKNLAKAAMIAFGVAALAPKVIKIVSTAIEILTVKTLTLGTAIKAIAGIAGIIMAGIAISKLTEQVRELKEAEENTGTADGLTETADNISSIGDSAEVSSDAVDDLSDAMNGLGDATEGLDTFLASFDEVNKVGGNNSLMSNLVNTEDLANILNVADGLGDINSEIDALNSRLQSIEAPEIETPTMDAPDFLTVEWWKKKWDDIKSFFGGYMETFFDSEEWWGNWEDGAETITDIFDEIYPEWNDYWEHMGENAFDVIDGIKKRIEGIIEKIQELWDKFSNSDWFSFWENVGGNAYDLLNPEVTVSEGRGKAHRRASGGYPNKGSLFIAGETGPELIGNFGSSQTKVINQSQITNNNSTGTIAFSPTIMIDGRKITATVVDNINSMTRSSGSSPLIELGG